MSRIYQPVTRVTHDREGGHCAPIPPLPPMRQDFSCAVAGEGVAVLFGGVTAGGTLTAAAVLLDADALQWRPLAVTGEPPRPCRGVAPLHQSSTPCCLLFTPAPPTDFVWNA